MHVLVTCEYKKGSGAFCCHGNQRFDPICPKTLCSLSPTQWCYKFDQDWPTGFRDIQARKCEIFVTQEHNSKMNGLIRPKIELERAFMLVLVTSNFDDDSIKIERARMETRFPIICPWDFFLDAQGQLPPSSVVRSSRNSNSSEILCMSSFPASIENVATSFSPLYVNWGFLLPWKPAFWSNLPQNFMQPFPYPTDT